MRCTKLDDPQVSPDGEWVAYTVRTADLVKDKRITHIWMSSWDGTARAAAHAVRAERALAALEPGRQVPFVPHRARR